MNAPSELRKAEAVVSGILDDRRTPLEVERLLQPDERRTTSRDKAMSRERMADDLRRITVRDHERWQETGEPPHKDDADLAGLLAELRRVERDREP